MSHYWKQMAYACVGRPERMQYQQPTLPATAPCGFETAFLLEDGCEGPRQELGEWVPVPFVAGRCPSCGTGDLEHVRWSEDAEIDIEGPLEVPHFRYPTEPHKSDGVRCGIPVYPRPVVTAETL